MSDPLHQRIHQHQQLRELRIKLLRLHKLLLEAERETYEQAEGQVSKGELLQLVIHHEQFSWLHRLSELIVQIDELQHADEPVTPDTIATFFADVRTLLTPDELGTEFAAKYDAALQADPAIVLAHADVMALLTTGGER